MVDTNERPPAPNAEPTVTQDQARSRPKRSGKRGNKPQQEGGDAQRQPKHRVERMVPAGYGDGIERAMCRGVISRPPRAYPVQHRTGLAVRSLTTVDRTEFSILLCDGEHDGPHVWPDGEVVGAGRFELPVIVTDRQESEPSG